MLKLTPELREYLRLLQEKKRRRLIRANLTEWARANGFEPAPHHQLLIKQLERLARGDIRRLAIFMPPGSAKSTYSSILFPPWLLAQASGLSILAASHTIKLAETFGRKVRNLVSDSVPVLGYDLVDDNKAVGRWATTNDGNYQAAGAGVGIAGYRFDLAVIDDPIKSREDADSETIRNRIWEWYLADVRPRLRPKGRIALIQTRWHEDDLAGRILAEMERGGEEWHVISLPAEAQPNDPLGRVPGEMLWDDEYGYGDTLRLEKSTQPARNWSALWQQNPTPEGGNFFRDEWLRAYVHAPPRETLSIYGAGDYAVTTDGGDYTVLLIVGVDPEDRLYLLDLWRGQTSSHIWVDQWCQMVKRWKPFDWADETGQITSALGPYRDAEASRQRAYTSIQLIPHGSRDKGARAQSIRARMGRNGGGLYVPAYEPWYADFRSELLSFPAGKHDDQVDALGLVGQLLDMMVPGRAPKVEVPKVLPGYKPMQIEREDEWKAY